MSRLPEVGDLLLSMSMDCWLSESSVRPAAANGSREEEEIEHEDCQIISMLSVGQNDQRSVCLISDTPHTVQERVKTTVYQKNLINYLMCYMNISQ